MMRKPLRTWAFAVSHLAAFAVGWLVWTNGLPDGATGAESGDAGSSSSLGERRRLREVGTTRGDEVLAQIVGDAPLAGKFPGWKNWAEGKKKDYLKLLAQAAETAPAENPAAAVQEALMAFNSTDADESKDRTELMVRLIQWMRVDPTAAITYVKSLDNPQVKSSAGFALTDAAMAIAVEKGPAEMVKWFKIDRAFDARARETLARYLGATGDLRQIEAMKKHFEGAEWTEFKKSIHAGWPMEKADELLAFFTAEKTTAMLTSFANNHGEEGAKWLVSLLGSGKLDDAAKEAITMQPGYGELMWSSPALDFNKRLEVLAAFRPGKSPEEIAVEIAQRDVAGALKKQKDYRYAFRNGVMSASEIHAAMAAELPQLAVTSPEILRSTLFKELAEEDGARAMSLLDGLAGAEKWNAAMQPVGSAFRGVNPQQLYNYLQLVPAEVTPEIWRQRLDAWTKLGQANHTRLGANYIDWVRRLPEGLDKDMAAYSLVQSLGQGQPDISQELTATIKDPRIRERLAIAP